MARLLSRLRAAASGERAGLISSPSTCGWSGVETAVLKEQVRELPLRAASSNVLLLGATDRPPLNCRASWTVNSSQAFRLAGSIVAPSGASEPPPQADRSMANVRTGSVL